MIYITENRFGAKLKFADNYLFVNFATQLQPGTNPVLFRGVAQLASALAWGARGRKFESSHPDNKETQSVS